MQIDTAQIPLGPHSGQAIADLLTRCLDPAAASFDEALRQVAGRVDKDAGRLPWSSAVLTWLSPRDAAAAKRTCGALKAAITDARPSVVRGSVLLLLAIAEQADGPYDDLLFDLTAAAAGIGVQQLVGAYLLATPRTRERALTELRAVPALSDMVDRQERAQGSLQTWKRLVQELGADLGGPYVEIVLTQMETHPELRFELENGYLDVFDDADEQRRRTMVRFLLAVLRNRGEGAQVFVCDLLTYPALLETARRVAGYRLDRLLHSLERNEGTPPRVRQYVASILAMLETSVTEQDLHLAARGRLDKLAPADWGLIKGALDQAREWFAASPPDEMIELRGNSSWGVTDYAHAALQLLDGGPAFPVPLEDLCRQLGIFLQGVQFASHFDGLLIQRPGLPGPVVLFDQAAGPQSRHRFTVAHELGHALLPWHAQHTVYISSVLETAEAPHMDEGEREAAATAESGSQSYASYEREADRFAAALLMPPHWFGPEVLRKAFTIQGLDDLRQPFGVSLTAAAFQAIQYTRAAVAVVYSVDGRIRYQRMTDEFRAEAGREAEVLYRLQPQTAAAALLTAPDSPATHTARVPAALWLSQSRLAEVREESLRTAPGHVLSIIEAVDDD